MKENKRKFYQKVWFKNTILITIPTLISVIGVIVSVFPDVGETVKGYLFGGTIILMMILIIFVIFSSNSEENIYKEYEETLQKNEKLLRVVALLDNDVSTKNLIITTFSEVFEKWAKNINSFANTVQTRKQVSDKAWDKESYFEFICRQCRDMIKRYCNDDDAQISVGFVICKENENGEKIVHMIAHSNMGSNRPTACSKEELLLESRYHFAEIIKEKYSDIEVAENNDEIKKIFKKTSITSDLDKYSQYIAIPMYCTKDKLLGVFQVVTKYDCIIEQEKVELLKFAEKNVVPYSNLIILADKINKGLYINPSIVEKE